MALSTTEGRRGVIFTATDKITKVLLQLQSKTFCTLKRSLGRVTRPSWEKASVPGERGNFSSRSQSQLPGCISPSTASLRDMHKVAEVLNLNQVIQNSGEVMKTKLNCLWLYKNQKLNLAAVPTIKKIPIKIHRWNASIFCKMKLNFLCPKKP